MADEDIQRYLDRIELQHSVRPRYVSFVTELLKKLDSAHGIMKDVPALYDINTATGAQLDVLGEILGVTRKDISETVPGITDIPDDDLYRMILLSKVAQYNWHGTNESLREIWNATAAKLFDLTYTDNQDMTVTATIYGDIDQSTADLLDNEYIIPKPAGVTMNTIVHVDNDFELEKMLVGIGLYEARENDLGTAEAPDFDTLDPLYDETEALLLDETGIFLEG